MGLIGRRPDQSIDCRLAERSRLSGGCIEINKLRGSVVIEQVLVVGRGQEILESWRGPRVAGAFAHMRTNWDGRLNGSGAAGGRNRTDDQGTIVAQPLDRRSANLYNAVDAEAGDPARLARGW